MRLTGSWQTGQKTPLASSILTPVIGHYDTEADGENGPDTDLTRPRREGAAQRRAANHAARLDAIISDLAMPDEDGLWVIDQLRRLALSKGGSIPALAVTAHWDRYTSKDAKDAGFDAFLTKPVDPFDLCRTVASLVGR